jgi:hypothetical protein
MIASELRYLAWNAAYVGAVFGAVFLGAAMGRAFHLTIWGNVALAFIFFFVFALLLIIAWFNVNRRVEQNTDPSSRPPAVFAPLAIPIAVSLWFLSQAALTIAHVIRAASSPDFHLLESDDIGGLFGSVALFLLTLPLTVGAVRGFLKEKLT